MPIVFDQVSFAYDNPKHRERQRERTVTSTSSKADWGTSPNALWALHNIDFTLEDGEFFGIAGHTGSGKSTLIQHMNGLLHPTQGRVLANGQDMADKKVAGGMRGRVGMVFQYPEHQLFAATVYDDVAFGPRNLGLPTEEVDGRVRKAMADVQLDFDDLHQKSPFELSGGQQRRVAFAGVLAMNPTTLVLDEPTAGLDPKSRTEFLTLVSNLHATGITVVMVSHNMDDLARLCDRMLVLNAGEQFALGTPAEVFSHAEGMRHIGLGVPAAQKLMLHLKEDGLTLPDRLYDEKTLADELALLYSNKGGCANTEAARSKPQPKGSNTHLSCHGSIRQDEDNTDTSDRKTEGNHAQ